jgi:DNA-binding XRE family transcriptional regulator
VPGVGEELLVVAQPSLGPGQDPIEVVPVVVLSQVFPARPSSIPEIRNFVRRCLAESPLTEEGVREVGETVFRALLDAAGPTGSINVAFRIFPEHVEVDVLHSDSLLPGTAGLQRADGQVGAGQASVPGSPAQSGQGQAAHGSGEVEQARPGDEGLDQAAIDAAMQAATTPTSTVKLGGPGQPATFAEWMSVALRREGLTQEAAARQLGVSVKTVSRWVGGTTEPRMRDLRRIQEVFGTLPLP